MQTQNIALGSKSMRAKDLPKNAPILHGSLTTKRSSASTTERPHFTGIFALCWQHRPKLSNW
jgi:hypothetical protein